jgi:hypothetical protein
MIPSCRHASQLLSEAMDRRLSLRERIRLQLHLLICAACRNYRRQLLLIRRAMQEGTGMVDDLTEAAGLSLSPEARERVRQAIERHL